MSFTSRASEAPAILQLQKWGASGLQLNLSQFREAFLSPTRELLVLLSYQCEALLLPLIKDDAVTNNDYHEALQHPGYLNSCSPTLASSGRPDVQDNVSITSETIEIDYSRSNGCPLVCDVKSLAWGICGDSYDQHEAASFREILLVSGNHGVTVHAFRRPPVTNELTEIDQEGERGGGKWVEWGPSTALPHCLGVDRTQRVGKTLDTGEDDSSRNDTQKRWMHSFLTKVDTSKSKGYYWTKFPERSQYPSSAVVVSFGIFDSDSGIWRFLFDRTTNLNENETFSYSDPSTGSFSYKCDKVFASSSHDLFGFALTLVDPVTVNTTHEPERNWRRFVLVARLGIQGIQWISSVKLDEYVNNVPMLEWADFGFSDKFLLCLNAAGLLYIFGAITGDHVAHIDLSQLYELHPQFHSHEEETVKSDVACRSTNIKANGVNALSCQRGDILRKTMFRRLLVASDTLMLAVIDEYGVVYVVCAKDHIPGINNSAEKSLPHFGRLGVGTMVGWEVGGAEISHQRPLSSLSPDIALVKHTSQFNSNIGSIELPKFQDRTNKAVHSESLITGFTSPSQIVENNFGSCQVPSRSMRSIFVPTDRYTGDDIIFFSTFGITRLINEQKTMKNICSQIVHFNLYVDSSMNDDLSTCSQGQRVSAGEAVGCTFQGCFYLVTISAFSVVLPSISVSSDYIPIEAIGYRQTNINTSTAGHAWDLFEMQGLKQPWPPWKIEILDRVLLYEGHEEADRLCFKNDWDIKISRMRRLQVALDYLKYEEIEISLQMLAGVSLAEEGVLRLLFAAVYLMFDRVGNDNEVSAASRLLALATRFTTRMIRKYGLLQQRKNAFMSKGLRGMEDCCSPMLLTDNEHSEIENSRRLQEMAQFLETIRNLQCRLSSKFSRPAQGLVDGSGALSLLDAELAQDDAEFSNSSINASLLGTSNQTELSSVASDMNSTTKKLALMSVDSFDSKADLNLENSGGAPALAPERNVSGRIAFPFENPKDMIARWETDNLDQKNIVKDALLSGRLPLAVLKLHLRHLGDTIATSEPRDTFSEVRDIGRAIAYDLFLKDEPGLAVATLQKLGEDAENCLRQLVFGTVRRSLRVQVAEEMKRYGYLGPYDWKILDGISLIERVYPCCSFWRTFSARKNELVVTKSINSPEEIKLRLLYSPSDSVTIACGDVDGVVLGSWTNVSENSSIPVVDDDSTHAFYWAAAAVWSNAWDQRTINRIVLGQPFLMGVNILWESQLEYHVCHNDWVEVSKLLDMIPSYALLGGNLRISLDSLHSTSVAGCNREFRDYRNYVCSIEDLDTVCMDVPEIRILRVSADTMCSMWLRTLVEKQLAKNFIFLKEYWEGTTEIVRLLAQSGFITNMSEVPLLDQLVEGSPALNFSNSSEGSNPDALHGLHKLVVYHCSQNNLTNLLDLYLDHHKLALDNGALSLVQDAVGDSQWAKWLLLLRVKGNEYDASFSNARSIASHNLVPGNSLADLEIDDLIRTVDDIAEGAGELAAIATLMYAPVPIQDCLSTGSVNRHRDSSAQCTLESLGPAIQRFPTLWRTLLAACFGQDPTCNYFNPRAKVFGSSNLSDYLSWRDNIFYSAGHDTSLVQMLPGWFSKAVRRLIQLYVQGPLGWQSLAGLPVGESFLLRDIDYVVDGSDLGEISTVSWEAAIQKHVEEQLYGSSVEGSGLGLEHHLHRGRALAAFNHLLSVRVQKLELETGTRRGNSGSSAQVQSNVQSDVHTLLAPVVQSEEPLLSSVMPLAVMHFEDSVLVASCAFLLELCGLSASMLRIDIAALRRISSFYKSGDSSGHYVQLSPKDSAFQSTFLEGDMTDSLARALAEDYLKHESMGIVNERDSPINSSTKQPSRALILVLQHLEKASLPMITGGTSCGSWLMNGNGDGTELRAQQKAASQHWSLVTTFCRMHQIPLSTKYLAALARDNDWVGFLSEAQVGGYPFEAIIQVASKEFNDPRLKVHISTVLKTMQSRKNTVTSSSVDSAEKRSECSILEEKSYIPIELFGIIADCEKQIHPGEALLVKAKDLCWSVLAMIASCFPDVSPLSCLTVWLEITAARETSSIKVNDIASQIANNVGAAVEATNMMSMSGRSNALHYNRRNSKRRRLSESASVDILTSKVSDVSTTSSAASIFASNNITVEDEQEKQATQSTSGTGEAPQSLSKMVAVLCEQRLFLPLLRAFEMFLPSCTLLPFIRALQAFSQMRLSEASVHLGSFSSRIKEESLNLQTNTGREGFIGTSWISSTAVKASDAMLSTCPSPYERRCLLQLLIATDFGDGGSAMTYYRRLYWKINLAEPSLRKDDGLQLGNESLDDASLLEALEMNGHWEKARNWAKQLEASGGSWKFASQHVTEKQAEAMVAEWKEFLWDVPEERVALWGHCQTLFLRYSFPPLQAGLFFLKHAEAVEKDLPAKELHELLLLSLQWLSGMITQSTPVYPLHLLREIETRAWLLAVESEAQVKSDGDMSLVSSNSRDSGTGKSSSIVDRTASIISKMDNHINTMSKVEKNDAKDYSFSLLKNSQVMDASFTNTSGGTSKVKRRTKGFVTSRRSLIDTVEKNMDSDDGLFPLHTRPDTHLQDENMKMDISLSRWEESIGPAELERAVLSLLEFGQITAARQLQHKLSPAHIPSEFGIVDAALKLASASTPSGTVSISILDEEVRSVIKSYNLPTTHNSTDPMQVLESLISIFTEGRGRGLCRRILSVVKAANVLGLSFSEAFDKQPVELLQLLSLKAQDSFEEAYLLVQTHSMPAASIARILAESFLKGLLAAHRGGYIDSQKEEGPAPLLWRFSDFLTWAELCPSEPEVGHALMRLVITGQEIPHACEVELLILSHHFYKSSACLDGVDVLVALAATRVEAYVSEGDFPCLARLITGVGNFHALNFILGILIENGQLDLLLQKYSAAADTNAGTAEAVRGFRMAVLTSLKQFNPNDLDAFAMVYNHFDMKHETASLLESRAEQSAKAWLLRYDNDQNEDLLESMRYYIEAAEVHSSIDAGNKTRAACAQASLVSLQIRMPDIQWLNLTATNARRVLVDQSRFQEALIVAEAYALNQPGEWALVLWNQMLKPELTEQFVEEFVSVLPLHPTMLAELARFYRAEVAARGDQSHFSVWLTGGGLPAEWAKYLGRSFRCLLKRTRDLRLRLQLATIATGFVDVIDACSKALDRVPDNGGPLVLRKGHGGAYLPLM